MGGYTSLDDDSHNNTNSEGIDDAGAQAVAEYVASHLDDLDLDGSSSGLTSVSDGNVQVEIVRGYSQVVAGTNYRLLLLFLRTDNNTATEAGNATAAAVTTNATRWEQDCLGAVAVEVYARFDGSLNITAWGNTVSCDRALQLWNDPNADYGPTVDDFDNASSSNSNNNASSTSGENSTSHNRTSSGVGLAEGLGCFPLVARLGLSLLALSYLTS